MTKVKEIGEILLENVLNYNIRKQRSFLSLYTVYQVYQVTTIAL